MKKEDGVNVELAVWKNSISCFAVFAKPASKRVFGIVSHSQLLATTIDNGTA